MKKKLIQNVGDTQQVFRRPEVDVDLFGRPGIGVAQAGADELDGNAFFIQDCAEIMAEGMGPELGYPGLPGKFFTEAVHAAS